MKSEVKLQDIKGVGEKLASKILQELGGEEELNKIVENMELERISSIEGISQRKAVEILNQLLGNPNITTRGFVLVNDNIELLKELEEISKEAINSKIKNHINYNEIKSEIISNLSASILEKTGRKPIILPVIMDIKKNVKINS